MSLEYKECKNCGTLNEADYRFCKNCGAPLENDNSSSTGSYTPPGGNGFSFDPFGGFNYSEIESELNGVPSDDVAAYVGYRSRGRIMNAFIAIKRGRKTFVTWSILLLGILLSLPYASAWLFYRKCYKAGLIVCAAVLLLHSASVAIGYETTKQNVEIAYNQIQDVSDEELLTASYKITGTVAGSVTEEVLLSIIRYASLGGVGVLSVFAYYFYYLDATSKIKKLRNKGIFDRYAISTAGGTSIAAAILIPLATAFLCAAVSLIPVTQVTGTALSSVKLMYLTAFVV